MLGVSFDLDTWSKQVISLLSMINMRTCDGEPRNWYSEVRPALSPVSRRPHKSATVATLNTNLCYLCLLFCCMRSLLKACASARCCVTLLTPGRIWPSLAICQHSFISSGVAHGSPRQQESSSNFRKWSYYRIGQTISAFIPMYHLGYICHMYSVLPFQVVL